MSLDIIGATGSALLVAVIVTILTTKNMTFQTSGRLLKETVKAFWVPIIMICAIIGIAKLVSPQSIAIATAAVGQQGKEST